MQGQYQTHKLFNFILAALGLVLSVYSNSRSFIIGFILAIFLVYILSQQRSSKVIIVCIASILALLFSMVFLFKTDSSQGRMLIYKISFSLYKNHWFSGIGLGNFKRMYLPQQAQYFSKGNYTEKELMLADNTHYAFNDYWQLAIETGLAGVLAMIIAFYMLHQIIIKAIYTKSNQVIKANVLSVLVAILTAAFFSPVFDKGAFQIATTLCVLILCFFENKKSVVSITMSCIALCSLLAIGLNSLNTSKINDNYKVALNLYIAGLPKESITELEKIIPIQDNKRAVLYMQILMASYKIENEKRIVKILELYPNANSYRLLGDYYKILDKFDASETAYITSTNMVPNRFQPRASLLKLYLSENKYTKAEQVAKEIVSLKVKVNSYQVMLIRAEAIDFLKKSN